MTSDQSQGLEQAKSKKPLLRFICCGSVGDGKSTLFGRLMLDSQMASRHQLGEREGESLHDVTEREPSTDLDALYQFFDTPTRHYAVANIPSVEPYSNNMAPAASKADLAIILVDANKGLSQRVRQHIRIAAMMGVKHVVLAVNKMDLAAYNEATFTKIEQGFSAIRAGYDFTSSLVLPLSALTGENITSPSQNMPWYGGPSLLDYLDSIEMQESVIDLAFRMPVRSVDQSGSERPSYSGTIAAGTIKAGDSVRVLPGGTTTKVKTITKALNNAEAARSGESIRLCLTDEIAVKRGDMLVAADQPPEVADQFEARLLWLSTTAMTPGRQYELTLCYQETMGAITDIKYKEDALTGAHLAAKTLELNDIATVNLSCTKPIAFEPYSVSRDLGSFVLTDKLTGATVGAGIIEFALRRASNIHWQALELNKSARSTQKHQTPACVWFTGLSGSGKSTIGNMLEKRLHAEGKHTYLLDGDNVRHGLNRDLGFTEADRVENIRRVSEVAKLMADAGLIVLVSFISPFRAERRMARDMFGEGEFIEVFVDTPIEECERRDVKGLYAKARKGELKNFTGIDSPYEAPETPEIHVRTDQLDLNECVEQIVESLK